MKKNGVIFLLTLLLISVLLNIAWCPAPISAAILSFLCGIGGVAALWVVAGFASFAYHVYHEGEELSVAEGIYLGIIFIVIAPLGVLSVYCDYSNRCEQTWR